VGRVGLEPTTIGLKVKHAMAVMA